jgi:hypothetical protein
MSRAAQFGQAEKLGRYLILTLCGSFRRARGCPPRARAHKSRLGKRRSLNVRFTPKSTDAASPRNDAMGHLRTSIFVARASLRLWRQARCEPPEDGGYL